MVKKLTSSFLCMALILSCALSSLAEGESVPTANKATSAEDDLSTIFDDSSNGSYDAVSTESGSLSGESVPVESGSLSGESVPVESNSAPAAPGHADESTGSVSGESAVAAMDGLIAASGAISGFMEDPTNTLPAEVSSGLLADPEEALPGSLVAGLPVRLETPLPSMTAAGTLPKTSFPTAQGYAEIDSIEDLQGMTQGEYVLTADLDLRGTDWVPAVNTKNGSIILDGQGHSITGLNGMLLKNAPAALTVKNLVLTADAGYDGADAYWGLLTSKCESLTLENCRISAEARLSGMGQNTLGTLAGQVTKKVTLLDSCFEISFSYVQALHVGGIAGSCGGAEIRDCVFQCSVSSGESSMKGALNLGGVLGTVKGSLVLSRCLSRTDVTLPESHYNANAGGLFGQITEGDCEINALQLSADVRTGSTEGSSPAHSAGGLAGQITLKGKSLRMDNCAFSGEISTEGARKCCAGGLAGTLIASLKGAFTLTDLYTNIDASALPVSNRNTFAGGLIGEYTTDRQLPSSILRAHTVGRSEAFYSGGCIGWGSTTEMSSCETSSTVSGVDAGGLAGYLEFSSIRDSLTSARVSGLLGGGMTGLAKQISFNNCAFEGSLSLSSYEGSDTYGSFSPTAIDCCLGGLAGKITDTSSLSLCRGSEITLNLAPDFISSGTVRLYLGGLLGHCDAKATASKCLDTETVSASLSCPGELTIGGLFGMGPASITACFHRGKVEGSASGLCRAGGILGMENGGTMTDCYATGNVTARSAQPKAGGLCGLARQTDYSNCYAEGKITAISMNGGYPEEAEAGGFAAGDSTVDSASIVNGRFAGSAENCRFSGQVLGSTCHGMALIYNMTNCLTTGSVTAERYGGGISCMSQTLSGNTTGIQYLTAVRSEMEVSAGLVGVGLVRKANALQCAHSGNVSARAAYGLVETLWGDTRDCQVEGRIAGKAFAAGLAHNKGDNIYDCAVLGPVTASFSPSDEEAFQTEICAAGLVIDSPGGLYNSLIQNCVVEGNVTASCSSDADHETSMHTVRAAGIAGHIWGRVAGSTVTGNIQATSAALSTVLAGGIGGDKGDIGYEVPITGCIARSYVSALSTCPVICKYDKDGNVVSRYYSSAYAGGIIGQTARSDRAYSCHIISSSRCTGSVTAHAADADHCEDGPWVGSGKFQLYGIPEEIEEEEPETYTAMVHECTGGISDTLPGLEGATVSFSGYSAETDADGSVSFQVSGMKGRPVSVTASKSGYWSDTRYYIPSADGVMHLYLRPMEPDTFYVTSCTVLPENNGRVREVLEQKGCEAFHDDTSLTITTKVEWNDLSDGVLWLQGSLNQKRLRLASNGSVQAVLGDYFTPGEEITLHGRATTSDGGVVTEVWKTGLQVHMEYLPRLSVSIDNVGMFQKVWALSTLENSCTVEGLEHFIGGYRLQDGHAEYFFTMTSPGFNLPFLRLFKVQMKNKAKLAQFSVGGNLRYPLAVNENSYFEGNINFNFGAKGIDSDDKVTRKRLKNKGYLQETPFEIDFNFPVSFGNIFLELKGVPGCSLNLPVKMRVLDPLTNEMEANLQFDVNLILSIFGGLGGEIGDAAELKGGFYGEAEATGHFSGNSSVELNGYVSGKVTYKLFDLLQDERELTLGSFALNPDTQEIEWTPGISTEWAVFSEDWTAADLSFEKDGGGFAGQDASLMEDAANETVLYENIGPYSDFVLSGDTLYFTAVDGSRPAEDALVLYASRRLGDGSWADPVAVEDDGTLDTAPSAAGSYLIWCDTDNALGGSSLDAAMAGAGVSAAVAGEDGYSVTKLSQNGDGCDFSAVIGEKDGMAYAAWLHNAAMSKADFLGKGGETTLRTAVFDGESWSEAQDLGSVGDSGKLALSGSTVYYKKDGTLYSRDLSDPEAEPVVIAENAGLWNAEGGRLSYVDEDGQLRLADGASLSCPNGLRELLPASDRSAFFISGDGLWYASSDTSAPVLLKEGSFSGLRVQEDSGQLYLMYFRETDGKTDLCRMPFSDFTDLVLLSNGTDESKTAETGMYALNYILWNHSTKSVNTIDLCARENGESILEESLALSLAPGASYEGQLWLSADGEKHTITLSADSGADNDSTDNSTEFALGKADADISRTQLYTNKAGQTVLQVTALNAGSLKLDEMIVWVSYSRRGEMQAYAIPRQFNDIAPGSACLFEFPAEADVEYTVEVQTSEDVDKTNNVKYLSFPSENESEASSQLSLSQCGIEDGKIRFTLTNNSGETFSSFVIAAAYDSQGKMLASARTGQLDLAANASQDFTMDSDASSGASKLKLFFVRSSQDPVPSLATIEKSF